MQFTMADFASCDLYDGKGLWYSIVFELYGLSTGHGTKFHASLPRLLLGLAGYDMYVHSIIWSPSGCSDSFYHALRGYRADQSQINQEFSENKQTRPRVGCSQSGKAGITARRQFSRCMKMRGQLLQGRWYAVAKFPFCSPKCMRRISLRDYWRKSSSL
jgi:hypothetical protein